METEMERRETDGFAFSLALLVDAEIRIRVHQIDGPSPPVL